MVVFWDLLLINQLPCCSHRGGIRSGRGGGGRGRDRGRGRGRGKKKPTEKSVDDLDKELENYHAEAMNVS